jgi:hypothetical protein
MHHFYEAIADGKSASESMKDARNGYLARPELKKDPQRAHPHYWASMVTVGREGPHLPQEGVNELRWLIWGVILAIVVALWQRRRKRRRFRD